MRTFLLVRKVFNKATLCRKKKADKTSANGAILINKVIPAQAGRALTNTSPATPEHQRCGIKSNMTRAIRLGLAAGLDFAPLVLWNNDAPYSHALTDVADLIQHRWCF